MHRNKVIYFVIVLLVFSLPAGASEFKDWIKMYEAQHYQQTEYKPVDPKADAHLIRKLDQVPMKLLQAILKSSYPQAEIQKEKELKELEDSKKTKAGYKIGKSVPINVDRLINRIRSIMLKYSDTITPVIGKEHKWSPEAKRYLMYGFWHRLGRSALRKQKEFSSPLFFRSKIFLLLGCGWTSRYAVTGQEEALKKRIMLYPDRSLQIHHMFLESYVLNRGNLYLTLLSAENVLAGNPYRVDRENDPIQKKLAYIRHDSIDMGDNYGAWYHFFGISMYALVRTGIVSRAVAEIESLGSVVLEGFDKQEDYINRYGAIFGKKLKKMFKRGDWKKALTSKDRIDYMLINPMKTSKNK